MRVAAAWLELPGTLIRPGYAGPFSHTWEKSAPIRDGLNLQHKSRFPRRR